MIRVADYLSHDAVGLADLVRRGEASESELVESALTLIERHNPTLNVITQRMDDFARRTVADDLPHGPFRGVPFLLKDLFEDLPGVPSNNGSALFRGRLPERESSFVRQVRAAGLVIVGKASSPELGLMPTTEPRTFGPARNPWNTGHTPGGSSGGSAAAVAAGIVPAAAASDGGGSIRIPAACCGLVGLKPSRGRFGAGPVEAEGWNGLATAGVVSRTVRDTAHLLDALEGGDPGEPYAAPAKPGPWAQEVGRDPGRLLIAVSHRATSDGSLHIDCLAALQQAAETLAALGHEVVEVDPPIDMDRFADGFWSLLAANTAADLIELAELFGRPMTGRDLEPWTLGLAAGAAKQGAGAFTLAFRNLWRMHRPMGEFLTRYDILLTPTLAQPPAPLGWLDPCLEDFDELMRRIRVFMPYTALANAFGHPAVSLPLSWNADGLPIGVMAQTALGGEGRLLRLAAQLEAATPWAQRRPPVWG